jgi:hypothetical protein
MLYKNIRICLISCAFITHLMCGCNRFSNDITDKFVSATQTTSIIPSVEITPTNTTSSRIIHKNTETPSPNYTQIATKKPKEILIMHEQCVTSQDSLVTMPNSNILMKDMDFNLLLMDLPDNEITNLGQVRHFVGGVGISPNHEKFAYIIIETNELHIVDFNGTLLKTVPVERNWQSIIQWISNDLLLIENMPLHADNTVNPPASSVLFNISREEQVSEFQYEYPNKFFVGNGAPEWGNYYFTQNVFDPSLSRVVYPGYDETGGALILWDIDTQQKIALFRGSDQNYGGLPQWANNGAYFVAGIQPVYESWDGTTYKNIKDDLPYHGGTDLFQVSRDGEVKRITYLTTKFKAFEEGYKLSPDEKYLAFWLVLKNGNPSLISTRQLALVNFQTKEILNLCVDSGDISRQPIWSPDGNYLLITVSNWEKEVSDVYIIDLNNGVSIKVMERAIGVGWLVKQPED